MPNGIPPLQDGDRLRRAEFERRGDYPSLEVRNMAAKQIAWILKMDIEPRPDWSKDQWTKLRARVQDALKRDGQ
jgi:hypothetical protein